MISRSKHYYMRQHSNEIRVWTYGAESVQEDPISVKLTGLGRIIIVIVCRNKQRLLQSAWNRWCQNTCLNSLHDYSYDVREVLLRPTSEDELRSEFEIEVLFKWVVMNAKKDPTGLANILACCKKKSAVINALQDVRLERFHRGEGVLFQGNLPRIEDGHFTVLTGACEVVQIPQARKLLNFQYLVKNHKWDDVKAILADGNVLATLKAPSGFGELATLANQVRVASIVASARQKIREGPTSQHQSAALEVLVISKNILLECMAAKRWGVSKADGSNHTDAIDFLRQSGLANRIDPSDLMDAALSMEKKIYSNGQILFVKGQRVHRVLFIVVGEVLLSVGAPSQANCDDSVSQSATQFAEDDDEVIDVSAVCSEINHTDANYCYILSAGSILGDEGLVGKSARFKSTAIATSKTVVCFEISGFGLQFLMQRLQVERFTALTYRDINRWTAPLPIAESMILQSFFDSLRQAISRRDPYRGILRDSNLPLTPAPGSTKAEGLTQYHTKDQNFWSNKHKRLMNNTKRNVGKSSHFAEYVKTTGDDEEGGDLESLWKDAGSTAPFLSRVAAHQVQQLTRRVKVMMAGSTARRLAKESIFDDELEETEKLKEKEKLAEIDEEPKQRHHWSTDQAIDSLQISVEALVERDRKLLTEKLKRNVANYNTRMAAMSHHTHEEARTDTDPDRNKISAFSLMAEVSGMETKEGAEEGTLSDVDEDLEADELGGRIGRTLSMDSNDFSQDISAPRIKQYLNWFLIRREKLRILKEQNLAVASQSLAAEESLFSTASTAEALREKEEYFSRPGLLPSSSSSRPGNLSLLYIHEQVVRQYDHT